MTTLAGLHIPDKGTWIGADRRASSEGLKIGPVQKWTRWGDWAIGCAGDLKTLDLVRAEISLLLDAVRQASDVIPRLERLLVKHNYTAATDGPFGAPAWGQSFLLASNHGLWDIDMQLSLFPVPHDTVWAAGSGRDFALGAGMALDNTHAPEVRVQAALLSAMHYDPMSGHGVWLDHIAPDATRKNPPAKRKSAIAK